VTKNGGSSWDDISKGLKGLPKGSWITQIKASQTKKGHALLVANDYRRFNFEPYAYRTTDYGKNWTRIVDQDDVISYVLCIIEHPEENNLVFLGTDDGLYVSIDAGDNWTKYTNGFPTVSVKDLVIHPREDDLIIGTFGRAAWVLDDLEPFTAFAKARPEQPIALYEPPTAYFASYQQPTGSRFGADAMFHGENRSSPIGQFKYFFDKDLKAKTDTIKSDSLFLKIYKGDQLIRTLNRKIPKEKGVYNWSWRLDEKGMPSPSRKINNSKREPSGKDVLPGSYKAVLCYGEITSEQMIEVKEDPRIDEYTMAHRKEMRAAQDQLQSLMSDVEAVTSQLSKNKKVADSFKKLLTSQNKKAFKEQIKATDSIVKQLEKLQNKYFGTPDKRQGITRNPEMTVMNRMYGAASYIGSRQGAQTATETQLYNQAKALALAVNTEAKNFLNKEWNAFVKEMKLVTVDMFKE
ncbi:MAG: hypothetical protein ACJAT0_000892, partial [Nonlabens sp.]